MNSISWFLYLAQVTDNLGDIFIFAAVVLSVYVFIANVVVTQAIFHENEKIDNTNRYNNDPDKTIPRLPYKFIMKKHLVGVFALILVACFIPSQQTMYLIAASELSEVVVTDDRTQKVFDALSQRIEKELGNLADDSPDKKEN